MLTIELASEDLERWTMTVWDWNRCPNLAIDVNTHMYCSRGRCYLSTLETTREENFSCFLFVFPHRTQWLVCQPTQILKMALYMSWTQSKMPGNAKYHESWSIHLDGLRMSRPSHSSSCHSTFSLQTSNRFRRESASSGYWPSLQQNTLS